MLRNRRCISGVRWVRGDTSSRSSAHKEWCKIQIEWLRQWLMLIKSGIGRVCGARIVMRGLPWLDLEIVMAVIGSAYVHAIY